MREIDKIAEGLFEKIRDRFEDVSLGDENAKACNDPEKARFFNFDYTLDGKNYGNITISIIDEISLKVYFSKNISKELDDEAKQQWYGFLRELREFARRNLLSFEPRDITRSTLKHRDVQQQSKADSTYAKDEVIGESKLYGTKNRSYENRGQTKIIVKHNKPVADEQRGARARHIECVYVENSQGERFKMPFKGLTETRAMARHISEGGTPYDELGQHITAMAAECSKLRPFLSNVRRRTFEDTETQTMVEAAFEYHGLLKNTLQRMGGKKGYANCKEQFAHTSTSYIPEDDMNIDEIKERFVKRVFNEKMDEALPLVYKAYGMKKQNKFAEQFESWANNVAEGWDEDEEGVKQWGIEPINVDDLADLFADAIPLGVDAINATNAVSDIIQNDDLITALEAAAQQNPEADARDIIIAWLEENVPAVFQELMNEIGDVDTPDQYSEDSTYGSCDDGMDGQVNEEDEEDSTDAIANAIVRRVLRGCSMGDERCTALLRKLGPEGIVNAAVDIAEFAGPVHEIGSSDVSAWIAQMERDAGLGDLAEGELRKHRTDSQKSKEAKYYDYLAKTLGEGKVKELEMDLTDLTDAEFVAKYKKTKAEMKAGLTEGQGEDYADKSWLKKQGKKSSNEPSLKDKLLSIPKGAKAWAQGKPDDDKSLGLSEMKRLAGLK